MRVWPRKYHELEIIYIFLSEQARLGRLPGAMSADVLNVFYSRQS